MRIGQGFDVHAFCDGSFVTLGGVQIPYERGLKAHSDGDVLLHALSDALLGAAALGDIGHFFPDTSDEWAGADSRDLLRRVVERVREAGFEVVNVDTTIIAQAPKMAPHVETMRMNIAEDLGVSVSRVSVKATTTERLGFTGRSEGIACQAICLLESGAL
ncbi:MAG: 2-C-methyl-D-erythritol 2,4-cyclodiphosphate synthase [Marinobacter sp.]|nr:2-C-methyl-D-erythritol 2,4-cyclodiphosphate synthase [Marinobacter sp.]